MAGPSIAVKVLADLKGFTSAVSGAGSNVESAAGRMRGAFSGALSAVNSTGVLGPFSATLDGLNGALDAVGEHGKNAGVKLMGIGTAVAGIGAGLSAFGSKEQAAQQQLAAAIDAAGGSYEEFGGAIEDAIGHQEKYGHTADETMNALQKLTQATHDPQKALDLLGEASDIAAAKHTDLTTASTQLGKVYNGNTKLLKEYGVSIDKNTGLTKDGKTAVQALAEVTAGQASAAADTFMGKLAGIKAHIEDQVAAFGQKYGPALQLAGIAMVGLGSAMEVIPALLDSQAAGWVATAAGELLALWPIFAIVAALALLGVGIYELVTHWAAVWNAIQAAAAAVFDWFAANWPLLLAILTGPFGIAVYLIVNNWQTILDFFKGLPGMIAGFLSGVGWILLAPFLWAAGQISNAFYGLIGMIAGLPGQIANVASGMWDGISGAFKSMLNIVIGLWNGLHIPSFSIGGWSTPFGDLPSWDSPEVNFPDIQPLATGGLVTDTGLFLLHAGEAVTPAAAVRSGPAVNIENATFSSDIDVDLFMQRVSWAMQRQRV